MQAGPAQERALLANWVLFKKVNALKGGSQQATVLINDNKKISIITCCTPVDQDEFFSFAFLFFLL